MKKKDEIDLSKIDKDLESVIISILDIKKQAESIYKEIHQLRWTLQKEINKNKL